MQLNMEKTPTCLKIVPLAIMAPGLLWMWVAGHVCAMFCLGGIEE